MKTSIRSMAAALALLSGLAMPKADAADVYDNRTASVNTSFFAGAAGTNIAGLALSVGSTGYKMTSFTFVPVGNAASTQNATVSLFALDSQNHPTGSAIATESRSVNFVAKATATTADQITVTPSDPTAWQLQANGKYAFLVTATGSAVGVGLTNPVANTPNMSGAGMTFLGSLSSTNSGSSWTLTSLATPWALITGSPISVPEPSTYALGLIATGLLASLARRRKSTS